MTIIITIIHVIVCFFLIVVVLLQSGKAADLAGAFGGMGSQTAFGPRGSATLLSKATTLAAALFMVTSLSLSILATRGGLPAWLCLLAAIAAGTIAGALVAIPLAIPPVRLALSDRNGRRLLPMLGATSRLQLAVGVFLTIGLLLIHPSIVNQ